MENNDFSKRSLFCGYAGSILIGLFFGFSHGWEFGLWLCIIIAVIFTGLFLGYIADSVRLKNNKRTLSDENKEAIKRVSDKITNSIVTCKPFDRETFKRVTNDLYELIHKHTSETVKDPESIKELKDIKSYLYFLRALYVKKPNEVKTINQLIDDLNNLNIDNNESTTDS